MKAHHLLIATVLSVALASAAPAALIHEYAFDQGDARDTAGTKDLTVVGGAGVTFDNGVASISTANTSYLQTTGYGGTGFGALTVSVWVHTSNVNQGGYKGLFANNTSSTAGYSWQIDNHSGVYRVISEKGVSIVSTIAPTANQWENLVVVKSSSSLSTLYVNGVSAGTDGSNLGNLDTIRVGANRNADNSYGGDYDSVQIWDSAENAAAIYTAGRFAPAHSWVAGAGGDTGGDSTWTAAAGGEDLTFDNPEALIATGLSGLAQAYASPLGGSASSSSTVFGGSGDVAFEIVLRPADLTGNHVLFEVGGNGNGTAIALIDDELRFVSQNGAANVITTSTTLASEDIGQWLHVVGVIDNPNDGTAEMTLYLDGQSADTASIFAGYDDWAGGDAFGVGRVQNTVAGGLTGLAGFDGDLAAINHYARVLDGAAVGEMHAAAIPEPASVLLMALAALGLVRRRR